MSPNEKLYIDNSIKKVLQEKDGISSNLENALNNVKMLSQLLEDYKGTVSQYIESKAKVISIQSNFKTSDVGSSYNLPGVFSSSTGAYDIDELHKANEANQKANDILKSVEGLKDTAYSRIVNGVNSILHSLRQISRANDRVEQEFFDITEAMAK